MVGLIDDIPPTLRPGDDDITSLLSRLGFRVQTEVSAAPGLNGNPPVLSVVPAAEEFEVLDGASVIVTASDETKAIEEATRRVAEVGGGHVRVYGALHQIQRVVAVQPHSYGGGNPSLRVTEVVTTPARDAGVGHPGRAPAGFSLERVGPPTAATRQDVEALRTLVVSVGSEPSQRWLFPAELVAKANATAPVHDQGGWEMPEWATEALKHLAQHAHLGRELGEIVRHLRLG